MTDLAEEYLAAIKEKQDELKNNFYKKAYETALDDLNRLYLAAKPKYPTRCNDYYIGDIDESHARINFDYADNCVEITWCDEKGTTHLVRLVEEKQKNITSLLDYNSAASNENLQVFKGVLENWDEVFEKLAGEIFEEIKSKNNTRH